VLAGVLSEVNGTAPANAAAVMKRDQLER